MQRNRPFWPMTRSAMTGATTWPTGKQSAHSGLPRIVKPALWHAIEPKEY